MTSTGPLSRRVALGLALALITFASVTGQTVAPVAARGECTVRVTLLQVNDVYHFMPVDRGTRGGLGRVSTLRKKIIAESPNSLFLLGGDTIGPSVESLTYKGRQMVDAWNAVGLDYAVFGNHEFDFGPDVLRERINESRFKWLGANVVDKKTGKIFADTEPFVVREFDGVKLGLFGLVLPETKTTSSPGPEVDFRNPCDTAKEIIPMIQARGARVIVALTHLSMKEDKELARCAPDIDVIVGGHEHTLLQSLSRRTPIFKMTADARELGRIDLNIDRTSGNLESIDWEIIPVTDRTEEDPAFASVKAKYVGRLAELAARVGRTDVPLDARSAPNRTGETNVGSFIADAFRKAAGADVALVNGGAIRADTIISQGELYLRDVLAILPFGNAVVKLAVKGSVLRGALEHAVARSGGAAEPGRFPQVSGLRFSYDTSLAPNSRVKNVTVNGAPLDDGRIYTLATTDYLARGGDGYQMLDGAHDLMKEKLIDSTVLKNAISSVRAISPRTDGRIARSDKTAAEKPCQNGPPKSK